MTTKATDLGKALRRLRVDLEIPMKSMANTLGFSVSFLSAIELGKKKVSDPIKFVDSIAGKYMLSKEKKEELDKAAAASFDSVPLLMDKESGQIMLGLARIARETHDIELLKEFLDELDDKKMET